MSTVTEISLNQEIVKTLCRSSAVSAVGLLITLQSRFPESNWTLELLMSLLQNGKKNGLYLLVGPDPTSTEGTGWQVNKFALQTNYTKNKPYGPFCNNFISTGCCNACTGFNC